MRALFFCEACKKTVQKKIIKVDNTYYYPIRVVHTHKNLEYTLMQLTNPITGKFSK